MNTTLTILTLAAGAKVTFPPEAEVRGTEIRLGQIAEITGDVETVARLEAFSLGYAPSPGYVRILRAWRIEQTVERDLPGVDIEIAGAPAVRVIPVTVAIEPGALAESARAALVDRFDTDDTTIELEGTLVALEIPAGSTPPELRALATSVRASAGLATVPVRVFVDGELYRTVWTQWRVRLWETRPVLLRDVPAGEVIDLRSIENRRVPIGPSRHANPIPAGLLVGSIASRDLAVGAVVTESDVRRPTLVQPGDRLFFVIKKGPVSARIPVTARDEGALGDRIRVTTESERELMGVITARNLVELDLSPGRVSR